MIKKKEQDEIGTKKFMNVKTNFLRKILIQNSEIIVKYYKIF